MNRVECAHSDTVSAGPSDLDRLVTGQGTFCEDLRLPEEKTAVFVRSPHAHADLVRIDAGPARASAGVIAVITGEDVLRHALGRITCQAPVRNRDGSPYEDDGRPLLAVDRVRFVGEPVVMVVADSLAAALDAADLVQIEYAVRPAVLTPEAALLPAAERVAPGRCNLVLDWEIGDQAAVDAAFGRAATIVPLDLQINRVVAHSLETRSVIAEWSADKDRFTVYMGTQGVTRARRNIARHLNVDEDSVRVVTPDVGGSFGVKAFDFPEDSLIPFAAKLTGFPVRWTAGRMESTLADTHGREQTIYAELALNDTGRFMAVRIQSLANIGAYLSFFSLSIPTVAGYRLASGPYDIPAGYVRVRAVRTNTCWVDAYRGAGRPECAYVLERLVDEAARILGIDRVEIRRRNLVPAAALPYRTCTDMVYDSGDFRRCLERALVESNWDAFEARRASARRQGILRGIGLASYVCVTANSPRDEARLEWFGDGRIEVTVGAGPSGQQHSAALKKIAADALGIGSERIRILYGDSDRIGAGAGTGGAKTLIMSGAAVQDACNRLMQHLFCAACTALQAPADTVVADRALFRTRNGNESVSLERLLRLAADEASMVAGVPRVVVGASPDVAPSFPNGCHVCEVEVDPQTGRCAIKRYVAVDDVGNVYCPELVIAQIQGGVVQGIGQSLTEHCAYDADGQPVASTWLDYALPRADDVPDIEVHLQGVPCTTNPLGVKGAGEIGCVGSLPAVANAVVNALEGKLRRPLQMPMTSFRIWSALKGDDVA